MKQPISDAEFSEILKDFVVTSHTQDERYQMTLSLEFGMLVVVIEGTVIQPIAEEFAERIDGLFAHEPARQAVIDLTRCEYLSSSAFGVLMEFFRASNRRGGQILLINPTPRLRKLVEILGMDQFFLAVDDLNMAKNYFLSNPRTPAV